MPIFAFLGPHSLLLCLFLLANNLLRAQDQPQPLQPFLSTNSPAVIPSQTTTTPIPLVLRACCGVKPNEICEDFQRPEEMYGMMCCGGEPSNQFEEICCNGVPKRRRQSNSFIDRCCGSQTLAYDQTCCDGVVHNIPSGECCGKMAYPRNSFNKLCCNGTLLPNVDPTILTCCGKDAYDGGKKEICCGGQVYLKELFDACCQIYGTKPAEFMQFNTKTHQCCDKPIERFGNAKCCYLKDEKGKFYPASYDINTQCCVPPFTQLTQKSANGTCVTNFQQQASPSPTQSP